MRSARSTSRSRWTREVSRWRARKKSSNRCQRSTPSVISVASAASSRLTASPGFPRRACSRSAAYAPAVSTRRRTSKAIRRARVTLIVGNETTDEPRRTGKAERGGRLHVAGAQAVLMRKRPALDEETQRLMILRAVVGDRRQPPRIGLLPGRSSAKFFAGNQSCAMGKICCRDALTSFELHGVEPQSGTLAASDLELAA